MADAPTTDWPVDYIADHPASAAGRLTAMFADASKLRAFVEARGKRSQRIEDAARQLMTERYIPDAVGKQLDRWGDVLGVDRRGRTDEQFRSVLLATAVIARSGGEPESVFAYFKLVVGADTVRLTENFPAAVDVTAVGVAAEDIQRLDDDVYKVIAAGVEPTIRVGNDLLPLGVKELTESAPGDIGGLSELGSTVLAFSSNGEEIELSNGNLLSGNLRNSPVVDDGPTDGYLTELVEV